MYYDVGRISFSLAICGKVQSPAEITRALGIRPDYTHLLGDEIVSGGGKTVGTRIRHVWVFDSTSLTNSKNLDEHARKVLDRVLPVADIVRQLKAQNDVLFVAKWESSRLDWGSGPELSPATCRDVAVVGIELNFDIYCSLEHTGELAP
ncbi:MAG: DUF4279 domain-containing protein [Candidatus Eremiobacteraeota bacterium]|nr:DUF4279 domain-containing protein [Candidatus Eremiobacteraeota bacterium]